LALQGTLDTFSLPDVLRLLATTSKTGRLRIEGDRGHGSVWLSDGGVVDADAERIPDDTGVDEVVFELLRFRSGSFAFDGNDTHAGGGKPDDVESILRRANALLSEWTELESVVPSPQHEVTLASDLSADEVTIDADRWRSLVAVGPGRTVGDLARVMGLTELGVSRAVRDLVDLGVADVSAPGSGQVAAPVALPAAPEPGIPPAPPLTPPDGRPALPLRGAPGGVVPVASAPVGGEPQRAGWLQGDRTGEVPAAHPERTSEHHPEHHGATANGSSRHGDETAPLSAPAGPAAVPPAPPAPPEPPAKGGLASRLGRRNRSPEATTGSTPAVTNGAGGRVPDVPKARTNDGGRGRNGSADSLPAGAGRDAAGRPPQDPTAPLAPERPGAGRTPSPGAPSTPGRGPSGPTGRPSDAGPARAGGPGPRPDDTGGLRRKPGTAGPGGGSRPGPSTPPAGPRVPGPAAPAPGAPSLPSGGPSPFDSGRLGPPPVGSDTGQIRPVPPSSLPPDLHWAADDTGGGPITGSGPLTGPINGGPISSPFSGLSSLGPAPNRPVPPPTEGEVAPHVVAMSPQARAAVQATVGNSGGSAGGRGSQGEDIAQRGRLISFLSTVR
jgi:Domain of unknown function (DUF4388)